jgi:hypothetical protein
MESCGLKVWGIHHSYLGMGRHIEEDEAMELGTVRSFYKVIIL